MPILIRDANANDTTELARLITSLGYPTRAEDLARRMDRMPAEAYRTLLAVEGNRALGFIGLLTLPVYEHEAPVGWVLALRVAEDCRRQGVGRALLDAAGEHYRQRSVVDVRLHSGFQRDGAHEFYEKMGFEKSGYRFKKQLT